MNWIPYILVIILFVMAIRAKNKLLNHVKNTYPSEWEKMNITKMGVKAQTMLPIFIGNSLKDGFLSKQGDDVLVKLHKLSDMLWLTSHISLGVIILNAITSYFSNL